MTFKEYLPLALRTSKKLKNRKLDLSHMGLGLGSEICELHVALGLKDTNNILEELSDISWFSAVCLHHLGGGEPTFCINNADIFELTTAVEGVISNIKRHIAYGQPIVDDSFIGKLKQAYCAFKGRKFIKLDELRTQTANMIGVLHQYIVSSDLKVSDVLTYNIDKLAKRYPQGFSDYHAATRLDKTIENFSHFKNT